MKPRLKYKISAPFLSLDTLVMVTSDLREATAHLPLKSVSPIRLKTGPPSSIGFLIDPGNYGSPIPFVTAYKSGKWSGRGVFETGLTCENSGLFDCLILHLCCVSTLDYADNLCFGIEVDDETGFYEHRSISKLIQTIDGAVEIVEKLAEPMRSFLMGNYIPPRDEAVDETLAVQVLSDLLEIDSAAGQ